MITEPNYSKNLPENFSDSDVDDSAFYPADANDP